MTDYTKLVKELRGCKYIDYCKDCPRMAANGYVEICNIKDDAADAIEALQAEHKKTVTQIFCEEQMAWEGRCKDLMKQISELQAEVERLKADVDAAYAH